MSDTPKSQSRHPWKLHQKEGTTIGVCILAVTRERVITPSTIVGSPRPTATRLVLWRATLLHTFRRTKRAFPVVVDDARRFGGKLFVEKLRYRFSVRCGGRDYYSDMHHIRHRFSSEVASVPVLKTLKTKRTFRGSEVFEGAVNSDVQSVFNFSWCRLKSKKRLVFK